MDDDSDIRFNCDNKFDLQLGAALIRERKLAEVYRHATFERGDVKVELKTETWLWRRTGNICVEFRQRGQPSGIAITEADFWVHELCDDDGRSLGTFQFPMDAFKAMCKTAYRNGNYREGVGDGGQFDVILLRLDDLLAYFFGGRDG